jgi:hypothetical protein
MSQNQSNLYSRMPTHFKSCSQNNFKHYLNNFLFIDFMVFILDNKETPRKENKNCIQSQTPQRIVNMLQHLLPIFCVCNSYMIFIHMCVLGFVCVCVCVSVIKRHCVSTTFFFLPTFLLPFLSPSLLLGLHNIESTLNA